MADEFPTFKKPVKVTFNVDPSDHSVGVFGEGFSAWWDDDPRELWCEVSDWSDDLTQCKFAWWDGKSGDACDPPHYAPFIQMSLHAMSLAYYKLQERDDEEEEKEEEEDLLECPECHLHQRWHDWEKCIVCTPCPFPKGLCRGDCTVCNARERFLGG